MSSYAQSGGTNLSITVQPQSQTAQEGGNVTFSVTVTGTGPFSYQWLFNSNALPSNIITTAAGNGNQGYSGDGGPATNASLYNPFGVVVDAAGSLIFSDYVNNRVRKVDTNGIITTIVGNGGSGFSGDGGPATNANLKLPAGIALDRYGNLLIADQGNYRVRMVSTNGLITTVAGNGNQGYSGDGGPATNSGLNLPCGLATDDAGNLFIADQVDNRIRKVDTNGIITTIAGNGINAFAGDGGPASNASLNEPAGVLLTAAGKLFIADTHNNRIRMVDTNGVITTIAGNGTGAFAGDGGPATNASLYEPVGVILDEFGDLLVADDPNNRVRMINPNGVITTIAGDGVQGYCGDNGPATNACLSFPCYLAIDGVGDLFITDSQNNRVRKVSLAASPTLTINDLTPTNAGDYSVIVKNQFQSVTSSVAVLQVMCPPATSTATVDDGFVVAATITEGGCGYTNAPLVFIQGGGGTGATAIAVITNGIVTGITITDAGLGYTSTPIVWIGEPPSIIDQPQSVTVSAYDTASFSVAAIGTTLMNYQWSFNGTNIPGATSSTFTVTNVVQTNLGTYAVAVSNVFGMTNSAEAVLSMYPYLIDPFGGLTTDWGYTNTLSVGAWGSGPFSYQWFYDGVAIDNATDSTLTLAGIQFTNAGLYSVVVSNSVGSVTNTPEQVIVEPSGVSIGLSPTITISGVVGYTYAIQRTPNLGDTNWVTLTNITLTAPVQIWVDTSINVSLPGNPQQYYRILPGP